jgi:hypothetical protein
MYSWLALLVGIIAAVVAWFSILIGWAILGLLVLFLWLHLTSLSTRFKPVPELSAKANEYLQQYSHYYAFPYVCRQLSGAASMLYLLAPILAVISIIRGFWLGVLFGAVGMLIGARLAPLFYPVNAPIKDFDRQAHESVVHYVESHRGR